MSRRAAAFSQADAARLLRAAEQVRPMGYRVRLVGGELVLEPVETAPADALPPAAPEQKEPLATTEEWRL